MTADTLLSHPLWRLVGWLPKLLLKRIFNPRRMSGLVSIDVRARGDQLEFDCGVIPSATLWLTVTSRSRCR